MNFDILVLVVDDMKTMRKIVIKSLKTVGFKNFVEAEDGQKAWEQLNAAENNVGLIISDWNMPNCSGLDFLKRVRADSRVKTLPFIMLTAESEGEQVVEAVKAGVDNYIIKPFSVDVLKQKLADTHRKKPIV